MAHLLKRLVQISLIILFLPVIVVFASIVLLLTVHFFVTVIIPIEHAMRQKAFYWYTWHDIKRMSGKRTGDVLVALQSMVEAGILECRLRNETTLKRLRKHYLFARKDFSMMSDTPVTPQGIPFYEFRLRPSSRGGRRVPWRHTTLAWRPVYR